MTITVVSAIRDVRDSYILEFSNVIAQEHSDAQRKWMRYFHLVTLKRAPWENSLPSEDRRGHHFLRDFTICRDCFAPKIKPNYKFRPHTEAALIRDLGVVDSWEVTQARRASQEILMTSSRPGSLTQLREDTKPKLEDFAKTQCVLELECEIIKVRHTLNGTFLLTTDTFVLSESEKDSTTAVPLADVSEICLRTRLHRMTAIEIFLTDGTTYLINFPSVDSSSVARSFRGLSMPRLTSLQLTDFKSHFNSAKVTEQWVSRKISNFQYLMLLNKHSGRTFNDISQYPVFPWILSDWSRETIDLSDESIFRDLSKPVGALNPVRLHATLEKQRQLAEAGDHMYMYSSGYSCPLHIALWMIRLEPFTSVHIDIQGGRFDHAARVFWAISHSFRLCTSQSNDYRELIPEFFTSPEFLKNSDKFDLGTVDGEKVSDVKLPPWCHSDAVEFVYQHRKALESDLVSQNLHNWIDLIWGYKQRGEKAVESMNVFLRDLYDDIWNTINIQDEAVRATTESRLAHVGQIPPQLFERPHPRRAPARASKCFPVQKAMNLVKPGAVYCEVVIDHGRARLYSIDSQANCSLAAVAIAEAFRNGAVVRHGTSVRRSSVQSTSTSENGLACAFSREGFSYVANDTDVMSVKSSADPAEVRFRHRTAIVCISVDGDWTAVGDRDASFSAYERGQYKFSIPIFTSSVRCLTVSDSFRLVVCGTRDGSLVLCALNSGIVTRTVTVAGRRPIRILITPGWGFILVYFREISDGLLRHFLALYTVNGDLVREIEIDASVAVWSGWRDESGFDWVALALENGACHVFEAFWLALGPALFDTRKAVVGIGFSCDLHAGVVALADGQALFIPRGG
jgi:hypothetical protein